MTAMTAPAWTVAPLVLPDSVDSPEAWALHGVARLEHLSEVATWGHADLHSPAPTRLTVMRNQTHTEKLALVATRPPGAEGPTADDVVGVAFLWMEREGNSHLVQAGLKVHPQALRSGVGTALVRAVEEAAAERGRTTVIFETDHVGEPPADAPDVVTPPTGAGRIAADAPGVAFARGLGYSLEQGDRFSCLRLQSVDPELVDTFLAESRAAAGEDYELVTWLDRCPEEHVEQLASLSTLMTTAVPVAGLDLVEHVYSVEEIRQSEQASLDAGRRSLVTAVRHRPTGDLVGYSEIVLPADAPAAAFQEDTLVAPAHRGHRLGMLLKAHNLVELRALRPGAERLHTWNAEENRHMLSINEALGFEPVGVVALWQKKLA